MLTTIFSAAEVRAEHHEQISHRIVQQPEVFLSPHRFPPPGKPPARCILRHGGACRLHEECVSARSIEVYQIAATRPNQSSNALRMRVPSSASHL